MDTGHSQIESEWISKTLERKAEPCTPSTNRKGHEKIGSPGTITLEASRQFMYSQKFLRRLDEKSYDGLEGRKEEEEKNVSNGH